MKMLRMVFGVVCGLLMGCERQSGFVYHDMHLPSLPVFQEYALKEIAKSGTLDVLFVVDDSASMGPYQKDLAENANEFIHHFTKQHFLDWRLGLISTSDFREPLIGLEATDLLDSKHPAPVAAFSKAVGELGLGGDAEEKPLRSALSALEEYDGFLRSNATLAIVLVTDAPEQSGLSSAQFLNYLQRIRKKSDDVIVFAVLASQDLGCSTIEGNWAYHASVYEQLVDQTKGKTMKLCTSFGVNLAALGQDLVQRIVRNRIQLKERPILGSIQVRHRGELLPGGEDGKWVYDFRLNSIEFPDLGFAASDKESVEITYLVP